ncbi:MAG: hypothetical protein QNK05_07850 [Myxococcota bacterium]|nr:hypothetical protein [Myxococcota bacterium]
MTEKQWLLLQAYHDGELSWLGRKRAERLLRRDAEAREQLEEWSRIGSLLREQEDDAATPDLWGAIRAELGAAGPAGAGAAAAADAVDEPGGWALEPGRWLRLGPPLAAAAAGAAVALTLWLQPGDAAGGPSIRWLDAGDRSAMVLQDDREATIIWVLEGQAAGRQSRRGWQGGSGAIL